MDVTSDALAGQTVELPEYGEVQPLSGVTYVNGAFFAVGYDYTSGFAVVWKSTDGVTWTDVSPASIAAYFSAVAGN